MSTNIIHELKKFLNDPQQITLEFSFLDFESSVFQGIRVVKELTTNKQVLTVVLVKNKALGSVSFFFRDSPTYQFALAVDNAYLFNDNNSKECIVKNFILLGNDPILGTQIKIDEYAITIYALINDGKTRGLDSFSFNQLYSDCSSVKSYSYALGVETLKKPTYQEPKKNSQKATSKSSNIISKIGIILIVMLSMSLLSNYIRNSENTKINSPEFEADTISIDTTASLPEISEFWIEKKYQNFNYSIPESMKLVENLSNENQQVIIDEDNNIGITISHSNLPEEYENETIRSLIGNNTREHALSTNDDNKKHFSDFQLIDYGFDMLGNAESFLVTQLSTKFSGKNISMVVKSYFVISSPNYYSITLSYPENSVSKEEVMKRIVDSFKFNIAGVEENFSTENNLEFLISTNGVYPKDMNLLQDSILRKRLKNLIGTRYNFLISNWDVENPIEVKNNIFVAFGCQSHNCDSTNFIIIIDFSKNILYCGVRENNNVKSFSEDGSSTQKLNDFVSGNF
jgi:hypothetical protein